MNDEAKARLKKFIKLGNSASYHFADDSGKEWQTGFKLQAEAIQMYKEEEDPFIKLEMESAARKFLWSLLRECTRN